MNTKILTKLVAIALGVPMLIATAEAGNARAFLVSPSNSGRPAGAGLGHFMSYAGSRTIAGHPFRALPRHTPHPRQGQDAFGRPHGPFAGSGQRTTSSRPSPQPGASTPIATEPSRLDAVIAGTRVKF